MGPSLLQHACLSCTADRKHLEYTGVQGCWGKRWSQLPDSLKIYAITDIKHWWMVWCIAVGCVLRDLFPDPDAALFLTRVTQWEFVAEFNALLQESLVGTEIQTGGLTPARTREAAARCICYRKNNGTFALSPPGRVMMIMGLDHHLWELQVSGGGQGGDIEEVLSPT